ncbi:MAG: hypothetical protein IJF37_00590 [Lachnospiraceae bacterium]|nr:hypothetical protein [Lachnospiraceae bacterium]
MRKILKTKVAYILFIIVFAFTTIAGCSGSEDDIKETVTDNNVTDSDVSLSSDDETIDGEHITEDESNVSGENVADDEQSETTGADTASDSTVTSGTGGGESETTSSKLSDESGGADLTEELQTTKKQENTTTKRQESTTTKKQENTTQKQTQQETTTKKQSSSTSNSSNSTLSAAEQMAKKIVDGIIKSGMSDFEKAITIHDWLTYNIDYDFTFTHYYEEETLRDRTGVCQGYALVYKMMCEMAGLEAGYVTGTGTNGSGQTESHAWNQVKIDGKWYNVDVTWDDPAAPGKSFNDHTANGYDYFLISDARIQKDHKPTSSRQTCPSDYDARAILKYSANSGVNPNVAYAENATDLSTAISKFVAAGKTSMTLWYYDTTVTQDKMWEVLNKMLKAAPCAVKTNPSYPPVNGVTKYILTLPSSAEWNSIPIVTSKEALAELVNKNFAAGTTTFDVRFEPASGVIDFAGANYAYRFSYYPSYYNNEKCVLLTIVPA